MLKTPRFAGCLVIVLAGLLSGCAMKVQQPSFPPISYANLPPIKLDVARVEVANNYVSPDTRPNVEDLFPVSLANSALDWGRDRLQAVGNGGVARLVVERASVVEVPLKKTTGLQGMFTIDQSERYNGVLTVSLTIFNGSGDKQASASVTVKRSQTTSEDISINERNKIWYAMEKAMMNTLNTSLEKEIRNNLRQWVRS